ncbi:hypothetical protein MJO29_015947, partial [Puccinia striiformis f. sp. tritici]
SRSHRPIAAGQKMRCLDGKFNAKSQSSSLLEPVTLTHQQINGYVKPSGQDDTIPIAFIGVTPAVEVIPAYLVRDCMVAFYAPVAPVAPIAPVAPAEHNRNQRLSAPAPPFELIASKSSSDPAASRATGQGTGAEPKLDEGNSRRPNDSPKISQEVENMGSDGSPKTNFPNSGHQIPTQPTSGTAPGESNRVARNTPATHPTDMGEWGKGPPQQKSTWADRLAVSESTEKPNGPMLRSGKTEKLPNFASQIPSKKFQSVAPPKSETTKPVSGVSPIQPPVSNGGWEKVSKKKAAKFNKPTTLDLIQNGFHRADQELDQAHKSLDAGDKEALRKKAESLRDSQDDSSSNNGIIPPENDTSTN